MCACLASTSSQCLLANYVASGEMICISILNEVVSLVYANACMQTGGSKMDPQKWLKVKIVWTGLKFGGGREGRKEGGKEGGGKGEEGGNWLTSRCKLPDCKNDNEATGKDFEY